MKEQTALARPLPPDATVEGLRQSIQHARANLLLTAAALKQDLTPLAKVREAVKEHPWLALGAAFAVGVFLGRHPK